MQREMDMLGLSLPSSCRSQIEKMVNRGIVRLRMNNLLDNPGMVLQAESNLKGLVRYFCDFSREVNTYPTLNDADFQKGLTACPTFFPYWSS